MPLDDKFTSRTGQFFQVPSKYTGMKHIIVAMIVSALTMGVTVTPVEAHWCDSGKNFTVIERAICSDRGLIRQDIELNRLYKVLGGNKNGPLRTGQRKWVKDRNFCNTLGCLEAYYDDRLTDLRQMQSGKTPSVAPPRVVKVPPPVIKTPTPIVKVRPPAAVAPKTPPLPAVPEPPAPVAEVPETPSSVVAEDLELLPEIKPF